MCVTAREINWYVRDNLMINLTTSASQVMINLWEEPTWRLPNFIDTDHIIHNYIYSLDFHPFTRFKLKIKCEIWFPERRLLIYVWLARLKHRPTTSITSIHTGNWLDQSVFLSCHCTNSQIKLIKIKQLYYLFVCLWIDETKPK